MVNIIRERIIQDAEFADFISFIGGAEEAIEKAKTKLYDSSAQSVLHDIKKWLTYKYEVFIDLFPNSAFDESNIEDFANKVVKTAKRGKL